MTTLDDAGRRVFAGVWLRSVETWARSEAFWFLRERMVAAAGLVGDRTLVPGLMPFLDLRFVDGENSLRRTAEAACDSLARLTGVDLRHDGNGDARQLGDAARAYRELLRDR